MIPALFWDFTQCGVILRTDISGQSMGSHLHGQAAQEFSDRLNLEVGTESLSRNVGK
jgi:hypothetical protein